MMEELYKRLAQKICGSMVIPYQGKQIDMGHWEKTWIKIINCKNESFLLLS